MTSRLRVLIEIAVFVSGLVAVTQASAQQVPNIGETQANVILGVLEDIPGEYAREPDFRAVRAIFKKVGNDWQAFPTKTRSYRDLETLPTSYPKEMTWIIAFDGRNLGAVSSRTPSHFKFYYEIGIEEITSQNPVPTVGMKSVDYSGSLHEPVYRPLVTISQPNVSDPEQWKRAQLSQELIAAARQQFRVKFPKVTNCRNPEENIARPWKYGDGDIQVTKAYSSKDKWSLIELNLTSNACDGEQDFQDAFHGQWYVIEPSGVVRFLGTDMWLVDAGDYDNDGKSEVLFAIDEHNKGGYRLFYRNFTKSAEFAFYYH
jgi:hypothetical protein